MGQHSTKAKSQSSHLLQPDLYRARNLVERFFNKIKHCRRVATRYDKLAANYLAFVQQRREGLNGKGSTSASSHDRTNKEHRAR